MKIFSSQTQTTPYIHFKRATTRLRLADLRLPLREDSSTIIISRHIARQLAILRLFQTMKQPKTHQLPQQRTIRLRLGPLPYI